MTKDNFFDKFVTLMDQNIRGVQYGVYTVAGIGFFLAMRSVRPLKKFLRPSDIPKQLIEKRMKFSGKVVKIQGGKTPIIYIDHYPIIALPFRSECTGLPVKISSVEVAPNGGIWMDTILQGSEVNFIPLESEETSVQAILYKGKQDVGRHLIGIGFAKVGEFNFTLDKEPVYHKYYKALIAAEKKAEREGVGVWQDKPAGLVKQISNAFSRIRYSFA